MVLALSLMIFAVLAAVHLAFRTKRGGWAGIPLAAVTLILSWFMWIDMPGGAELAIFVICAGIAGLAASGLPKLDRLAAIFLGSVATFLMLWVVPSGPDSPLNIMIAACTAGFAVGALVGTLAALFRPRATAAKVG